MNKCKNCGHDFDLSYCSNCGQKKITERITTKSVFVEFLDTFFMIDSPLIKTLTDSIIRPGKLVRTYLDGKRKIYVQPFQFFLLLLTFYLITINLFNEKFFEIATTSKIDSVNTEKLNEVAEKLKLVITFVKNNLNIFYFILPVFLAFYLKVFYKRKAYNYGETLVFSLYVVSISFLISFTFFILSFIQTKIYFFKMLFILLFITFAINQFTEERKIIKNFFISLISFFSYILVVLILTLTYLIIF